jgi:hypothetical protein
VIELTGRLVEPDGLRRTDGETTLARDRTSAIGWWA